MKPSGYIDVANLIGKEVGCQRLNFVGVQHQPRAQLLTTGKVDLVISSVGKNAEREGHRLLGRLRAVLQRGVFEVSEDVKATKVNSSAIIWSRAGSIQDLRTLKIAPAGADIKALRGQQRDDLRLPFGPDSTVATGNVVAAAVNERGKLRR